MAQLNPRIAAKLKQIPDVAVEAARQAMEDGADEIVADMRANAPRGATGKLQASIGWTWGELPPGTFMIDEIRSGNNAGDQYATMRLKFYAGGREAFYARFIEFGTSPHSLELNASVKRGKRQGSKMHPGIPAQPFFFAAWKKNKAAYRRNIRNRVRAAIREAWRNG